MFPSKERNCVEKSWFKSYETFGSGKYTRERKTSFNNLYVLNDDSLAGGRSLTVTAEESSLVLLLPVTGVLIYKIYKDTKSNTGRVHAGGLQILYLQKGDVLELANAYEDVWVNYLQLWIRSPFLKNNVNHQFHFNLDTGRNQLISVTKTGEAKTDKLYPAVSIGRFTGGATASYKSSGGKGVFVFVIQGICEVPGSLLHMKDGIGLSQPNDIELKALSNDTIVLLIELDKLYYKFKRDKMHFKMQSRTNYRCF